MALVINAKVIRAMEAEQVKEMVLRSAAFDNNADGGCALPMKQLSGQLFDEDPERILSVLAITKSPCITPPNPDTMMALIEFDKEQPAQETAVAQDTVVAQDTAAAQETADALEAASSSLSPKAAPFSPAKEEAKPAQSTVATPEEFLASFRQRVKARKHAVAIVPPHRRILFKELPEAATIYDVLCLVHGGAVDRAWRVADNQIIVQFCDDAACKDYYEMYPHGIRVDGDHVITIEKPPGTGPISIALREKIDNGVTRVVHLSGIPKDRTFEAVLKAAANLEVDHVMWRSNGEEKTDAWFLFANMTHAWEFRDQLSVNPDWQDIETEYLPDPCKEAKGFHCNIPTSTYRMSSAVANTDTA